MQISPITSAGYSPPAASEPAQTPAAPALAGNSSALWSASVELPAQAVQAATPPLKAEQIKDAVNQINQVVPSISKDLRFMVDRDTGIQVIKVVDTKTDEVIRQIPSEEIIELAKTLDKLHGLLIHQTA